jgi:SpoU rRNA methylase family enzyme
MFVLLISSPDDLVGVCGPYFSEAAAQRGVEKLAQLNADLEAEVTTVFDLADLVDQLRDE